MKTRRLSFLFVSMTALSACLALSGLGAMGQASPAPPGLADCLNVVGVFPLRGDPFDTQCVVYFDKPVVLPPAADGATPAPFTIQPDLPGQWRIQGNAIAFTRDSKDLSGRIFTVELNPALQSADGKPLNPAQPPLFFPEFRFQVERTWIISTSPERTVFGVLFPVPVNMEGLRNCLTLKDIEGNAIPIAIEQGTGESSYHVVVQGPAPQGAVLSLAPGLTDQSGRLQIEVPQILPSPKETPLTVTGIRVVPAQTADKVLEIRFSTPVAAADLEKNLRVIDVVTNAVLAPVIRTPGVQNFHVVAIEGAAAQARAIRVTITAGLPDAWQGALAADYVYDLPQAEAATQPPLQITDTWFYTPWGNGGKDGLVLRVQFNDTIDGQSVREHIEFVPALEEMRLEPAGNGFLVYGQWNSRQHYEMRLLPGVRFGGGQTLQTAIVNRVKSRTVPPYVGFAREEEYVFPRRTGLVLPMRTRNLDKVKVVLYRMFPSNLAVAVDAMQNGKGSVSFNEMWCEEVARKDVAVANIADRLVETPLDLDKLFPPDKKGVFCLSASGNTTRIAASSRDGDEEYYDETEYASETKLVLWSDIGVLAHWQQGELALFVHDLFSLAPRALAKATVYSNKNQILGAANTDERGVVQLKAFDPALGLPAVALIEHESDCTFIPLKPRQDDAKEFTDQMPRYDRKGYDAFIYADRNLYRPGESIHAYWLVNTNYGDAVPDVPLLATVLKPNGKSLLSQPVVLSSWGRGGLDLNTQKSFPTGKYTLQLSVPGSEKTIGIYEFNLEEFVPNRIKAAVSIDRTIWLSGESYPVTVNAQHLFGAPAADRKAEVLALLRRDGFTPANWKGFTFGNDSEFIPEPIPCGEQTTDAGGNASFTFSYQAPEKATFPMKTIVIGRVFELGGRSVMAKTEATFFPSDIALGLNVASGAAGGIEAFVAAVTPDEKPAALDKVLVTLEKQVWNYYVRRYYTHYQPRWSESFQVVETREVLLADGRGSTVFTPNDYGYYRIRVHSPATPQYSTISFYAYGGAFRRVDAARPSLIKVSLDKETYAIGEEAVVKVESPFDGKGVLVVQGDEIQDMIPFDIKGNIGLVRVPVTERQFPNVWLETTVIHAIQKDRTQVYPFSSFAMLQLPVRNTRRELAVTYPNFPQEIRPASEARFEVQVNDAAGAPVEAELTLAAVDEGIHGITGYESPDPVKWLYRPRRPDFRRAHYYDKVAYDFDKPAAGGDALLRDLQKRMPSADENWVKPVALWSGAVRTDTAGHATVTMTVPEFTGQLRVVAVAGTSTQAGAYSANVFVRRPYLLRTSLPRFLLPGDAVRCPVSVFNNSDAACKARISWTSSGAVAAGAGSAELDVAPHAEARAEAAFTAGNRSGQGEIRWETVILDTNQQEVERLTEIDPIPVRTPTSFQSRHEVVQLNPGEAREIRNTAFLDDERAELEIAVGPSPLLQLQDALKYAVHYPYGCLEQTVSGLMPLFLLRKQAEFDPSSLELEDKLDNYIQSGITRLMSMQTASGGMGTWPGAWNPYPYGSVYALHFLTLVKQGREFWLPEDNFASLQNYVRNLAMDWTQTGNQADFLRAYALYALALDGDAEALRQIRRFDTVSIPRHARYLLAAVLAQQTQDTDRVSMYLSSAPAAPWDEHEQAGTLNSQIRNVAVELLALQQIGGHAEEIQDRAQQLVACLRQHRYSSTQETAFIITALAVYLSTIAQNADTAAATISGPEKQDTLAGAATYRAKHVGPAGVFRISNTGSCLLYVNVTMRGVPEQADVPAASAGGLVVNRAFQTNRAEPYPGPVFQQGQSYVVDVAVNADTDLANVVVVDMLPAGFEIENPRLDVTALPAGSAFKDGVRLPRGAAPSDRSEEEKGGDTRVSASFLDVRDDRLILAFDTLPRGLHHFYYVVRAVTPGAYQQPPVTGECMYDATIRSNSAVSAVEVK